MWIDDKGVAHTVALPDPTDVMTEESRVGLVALLSEHAHDVAEALEDAEERIFDVDLAPLAGPDGDSDYVGVPPPSEEPGNFPVGYPAQSARGHL